MLERSARVREVCRAFYGGVFVQTVLLWVILPLGLILIALAPGRWAYRAGMAAILPAMVVVSTVHIFGERITLSPVCQRGADVRS